MIGGFPVANFRYLNQGITKVQDICLLSTKISEQKLQDYKTISPTNGRRSLWSGLLRNRHIYSPSGLKELRDNYFHSQFHAILETNRKKGTKVDERTAQEAGHRRSLSGSMFAA